MGIQKKLLLTIVPVFLLALLASAQIKTLTGTVKGVENNPLSGVTVQVKGTTITTLTGTDGSFSIQTSGSAKTLVFSYAGMKTQEVSIAGNTYFPIQFEAASGSLNEVVVVGYGTQKKIDLTGSVSTVDARELTKRPSTNVQSLLQGKVPGLEVTQAGGKPGNESNTLLIRGLGTFSSAGSNPLVMIDGVQGDMTNLNPDDVESISVLKDAASGSIYGAQAANGVILITTKKGKAGAPVISYNSSVQVQSATRLPDLLSNSADYMQYWNEGRIRSGQSPYFTQGTIDAFRSHPNDPVNYPNFNWIKHEFHSATANNQFVNIEGGNEKSTFNLSLGYYNQPGIVSDYGFKKYSARLSAETKVKEWLTIGGQIPFIKKDINQSSWDNSVDYEILNVYGAGPNYTPTMKLPDGTTGYVARYSNSIGEWTVRNPDAQNASGIQRINSYNVAPQFYVQAKIFKDLTWYTKGALTYDFNANKRHEVAVNNYFFDDSSFAHNNSPENLGVQENWQQNMLTTLYSTLDYQKSFKEVHHLNVLIGYNQESNNFSSLGGSKITFPTPNLSELDAGASLGQTTSGTANQWAIRSYFGRANYNFKDKYLFEINGRYDGTSRISPQNRWGFFPSLSAGWNVTQEPFMKNTTWLQNLKIRGSWGKLGNQNVGNYPYQPTLSTTSYPFNSAYPGALTTGMVDPSLQWETTAVTDIGADINVKNGLFTATVDWYNKVTDGILYNIPVPASLGLSAPTVNYGSMKNTGFEVVLGTSNRLGDFGYNVSVILSHNKNEVLKILAPSYGRTTIQEGLPFNSFYMVQWDGIFQNQAEIDKSATHPFNPKPGDLKFKDANGDGVIDAKDRVVVPGAFPKFDYSTIINLTWKNFDLSAFIQGVYGLKASTQGLTWGLTPFIQGSPPPMDLVKHQWTGEGSTNKYPAMYISGYGPVTGTTSTYFLLDASYVRLKNLAIGYDIPGRLARKIGFKSMRVYVSGDNLITITKWPGSDPEKANNGWFESYPQLVTYTLGLKVKL
ncbi:MAG: TonB-dependent receptor [Bacteroidota bacterium]|nr:TonB-dependent receptor [Bacteroidota bacterium]